MKKTILFLLNKEVTYLPPFMAILDSLCSQYSLKVISYEKVGGVEALRKQYAGRDVTFLSKSTQDTSQQLLSRVKRRAKRMLNVSSDFHKEAKAILDRESYDLLWIIHENTAIEFTDILGDKSYLLSIYELHDTQPSFLKQLEPVAQNALRVIAPEYNRACILKFWLQLDYIPSVIPNKPYAHPRKRDIDNMWFTNTSGKKVLLYQGYLNKNRSIDTICAAVEQMHDWMLLLLGKGEPDYVRHLTESFPNIVHVDFVEPPHHLDVTSWARVGIVKYDWYDLNHAYCAPNKTWEYAGFGIPMIGNELPGLRYTIGQYGAGICTNLDSIDCIRAAIMQIDHNYEEFSKNATKYYNSFDIKKALDDIVKGHI